MKKEAKKFNKYQFKEFKQMVLTVINITETLILLHVHTDLPRVQKHDEN